MQKEKKTARVACDATSKQKGRESGNEHGITIEELNEVYWSVAELIKKEYIKPGEDDGETRNRFY